MSGKPEPDTLVRLRRLDTCALSDALDRLSLPGVLPELRRWGPGRLAAGRVTTVALEPGPPPPQGSHLGTRALSAADPDTVIVVANAGRTEAGAWGGLLTLEAHHRRVAGVVVDGALRDVDEVEALDVPVFARATTPRTARGRFHEVDTDVTVSLEGVKIEPGGFIVADGSGVVFVTERDVSRVLPLAEEIAEREAAMADELRQGRPGRRVLDAAYEGMLEQPPE